MHFCLIRYYFSQLDEFYDSYADNLMLKLDFDCFNIVKGMMGSTLS